MMPATPLPLPHLQTRRFGASGISALTDEGLFGALGVRVAFTGREGGASAGPYGSLNLGGHVGDDTAAVAENRSRLLAATGAAEMPLLVANQVHGDNVVEVDAADAESLAAARARADRGADGFLVTVPDAAALLCFADCTPVVIVSPSGRFAVVHAGWRGVVAGIAPKAARLLAAADAREGAFADERRAAAQLNVYFGPHIRQCCFETGADVQQRFREAFGPGCVDGSGRVSMEGALRTALSRVGVAAERMASAGACTRCLPDRYFSYRESGGVCGRHGALVFRKERPDGV